MKILVTGATGYIGGSVSAKLMAAGHKVVGLTRSDDGAAQSQGYRHRASGRLADQPRSARRCRARASMPSSTRPIRTIPSLSKPSFRCSKVPARRSSIPAAPALLPTAPPAAASNLVFHEDTPYKSLPERQGPSCGRATCSVLRPARRAQLRAPADAHLRPRLRLAQDSVQVPRMLKLAIAKGKALHIGARREHLVERPYRRCHRSLSAHSGKGAARFAVLRRERRMHMRARWRNRSASCSAMAARPESWPMAEALKEWGISAHATFASNSRVSALKAHNAGLETEAGRPLLDDIEHGSYREGLKK